MPGSDSSSWGRSSPLNGGSFEDILTAIDPMLSPSPLSGHSKPNGGGEEEKLYVDPLSLLINKGEAWAEY
jgi:hypothetical protein